MSCIVSFRKTFVTAGILAILPAMLFSQEHAAEEARSPGPAPDVSVLRVNSESLLRVDFPGHKSWGRVKKGSLLEGRLSLPLYAGDQIAVPADSTIRVTVSSVERIREDLGFWRKTGRAIVRAFNPLETGHPTEYRVELSAADLLLRTGEVLPLDTRVVRAGSGAMVRPKTKSLQAPVAAQGKDRNSRALLLALRRTTLFPAPVEPNIAPGTAEGEQRVARAYMLTAVRASLNHQDDTFRAELAEPLRLADRVLAPRTVVEGTVVRSVPPRMLSRAGRLNLRVDRIVPPEGEPLRVSGSLSAAETNTQTRFALDEEGTLHGRKPGILNGLVDLGYAYVVGKVSDDLAETPIHAIGASMSDAAVANAARYVGLGTSLAFLITRRGRDVYLPKYAVIEIDFGRLSRAPKPPDRD
jgi:hypothetical protein